MRNSTFLRGPLPTLLATALAALGCGGSSDLNTPDRYNGVVVNDTSGTGLDAKFLPVTSAASTTLQALCTKPASGTGLPALKAATLPCYPAQVGYVQGKAIAFYNVVGAASAVRTTPTGSAPPLFPMAASSFPAAYNFPGNCTQGKAYDPVLDNFPQDAQFPVFSALPLPTTAFGVNVLPVQQMFSVAVSGNNCNDLKRDDSITAGKYGAKAGVTRVSLQLWAPIDMTSNVMALPGAAQPVGTGWYEGLQLKYLDGGRIPVDGDGNVVAMDGVIVNGASFASVTDSQVVLLPAQPGQDAYSPVVRLRQFTLPPGGKAGDVVGICAAGASSCPANYVRIESTTASFNTIFIVSTPQ